MSKRAGVDVSVSKIKDESISKSKDGSDSSPGPAKDKKTALLLDKVNYNIKIKNYRDLFLILLF